MVNVTAVKHALFGQGVLADVSNLDTFLGVSSGTYHFTRLACRKALDSVIGAGYGVKYGTIAAGNGLLTLASPAATSVAEQLKLPDAWRKISATAQYTWRGIVNCSFLTWTIIKPIADVLILVADFIWDGVEPVMIRLKDSFVDGVDDAVFTFQENLGEAMGPTMESWGKTFGPVYRLPGNMWRAYMNRLWRPVVFFVTYPELYGNLQKPVRPAVKRLRWGEKCRAKLWGEWTECSVRCGKGYAVRVNHCGKQEVRRCEGAGTVGCDGGCDSGATFDCKGLCQGSAVMDCAGKCGGAAEVGCDGKCEDPPALEDITGKCCVAPSFIYDHSGLCNTTADEESEMIAEAMRIKARMRAAKAKLAKDGGKNGGKSTKAAKARKGHVSAGERMSKTVAWNSDDDDDNEDVEVFGEERAAAMDAEAKARAKAAKRSFSARAKALARSVLSSYPVHLIGRFLTFMFSRLVIFTAILGALSVGMYHVVAGVVSQVQNELDADPELDDGTNSNSDRFSDKSTDDRVSRVIAAVVVMATEWWKKYLEWEKARNESKKMKKLKRQQREAAKANTKAEVVQEKVVNAEEKRKAAVAGATAGAATVVSKEAFGSPQAFGSPVAEPKAEPVVTGEARAEEKEKPTSGMLGNLASVTPAVKDPAASSATVNRSQAQVDDYTARRRALSSIVKMAGDGSIEWAKRLRCFGSLVRLAKSGGNRPYLIVELGAIEEVKDAMKTWVVNRNLQGPDSALQLLRVLTTISSTQAILPRLPTVRGGECAMALLDVLQATPGVLPVQRNGLSCMWALVKLAGPHSGVAERLVRAGLYEHLEDELEDSHEDQEVAFAIGGCVMQLALGNTIIQAALTNLGAQALIGRIFEEHETLEYQGRFTDLRQWLMERPVEE